jgi:hypothetical protein
VSRQVFDAETGFWPKQKTSSQKKALRQVSLDGKLKSNILSLGFQEVNHLLN